MSSVENIRPEDLDIEPPLDDVRDWFARFVCTVAESDLDVLALWAAHSYLCAETYTTPRLVLDSPVPESGKTTVLDHFKRLCRDPIQVASLTSPALLPRLLEQGPRTVLLDEVDRMLAPGRTASASCWPC
jgi:hypothetical protein